MIAAGYCVFIVCPIHVEGARLYAVNVDPLISHAFTHDFVLHVTTHSLPPPPFLRGIIPVVVGQKRGTRGNLHTVLVSDRHYRRLGAATFSSSFHNSFLRHLKIFRKNSRRALSLSFSFFLRLSLFLKVLKALAQ